MARKRDPVKAVEYESESGEEEDDEVDSEESDSEPEQTQAPTPVKSQSQPPIKKPPPSSSEEEESGYETESDSDGPDSTVRPPPSKPMDAAKTSSSGARNSRSKPNAPEPVTPTNPSATKRPAEEDTASKDAKKAKKTAEPDTSDKRSNLFQRLWSEEDEIVVLRGMIDYSNKKKSDPISDLNCFHDFIKKNLHVDVSRAQLQDKIRRLKKKYENNKKKEKEGKQRTFAKPHEQNAYDLSKEIWGNENSKENGGEKVRVNVGDGEEVKKVVVVSGEGEKPLIGKRLNLGSVSAEERMLMNGREMFEVGEGVEGEEEWEGLRVEELKLYLKQLEVRVAQTKLVLNAMNGKDE